MTVANTPTTPERDALLHDIPEAGAILRCSRSTVYNLLEAGEITAIKIGRRRLVTHDSLVTFVQRQVEQVGA